MDAIVADVLQGFNLQVNSRAGAGKTTLLIAIAKAVNLQCVILTYNRALCDEANERLKGTPNCQCFTIHALFGRQTGTACHTDTDLLYEGDVTRFNADIVLIDEAQDLRPTLYDVIMKMSPTAQYVLCGDDCQVLYNYVSGDAASDQYLNNGMMYFQSVCRSSEWKKHVLDGSYRLTASIADIASVVFGAKIHSLSKVQDVPVQYLVVNPFDQVLTQMLRNMIDVHGAENVLVLGRSVTGAGNAIRCHVNRLCTRGYRFNIREYIRGFDNTGWKDKTRVWTFCGSKGCQAKVVFVFGAERCDMTHDFGVALSRSEKHLIVVHAPHVHIHQSLERCTSVQYLSWDGDNWGVHTPLFGEYEERTYDDSTHHRVGTRLNLAPQKLLSMMKMLPLQTSMCKTSVVATSVSINSCEEDVSVLYGKAIEYLLQVRSTGFCPDAHVRTMAGRSFTSTQGVEQWMTDNSVHFPTSSLEYPLSCTRLRAMLNSGKLATSGRQPYFAADRTSHVLKLHSSLQKRPAATLAVKMANHILALDNYIDRSCTTDYEWVDSGGLLAIVQYAEIALGDLSAGQFKYPLSHGERITAKAGWVEGSSLLEFAFTQEVSDDARLQLTVHTSMLSLATKQTASGRLYNAHSGELWSLSVPTAAAGKLMKAYEESVLEQ